MQAAALEDPKKLRKENDRLLKWQKMLAGFDEYRTQKSEKLASRTWKGLPDAVRGDVWTRFTASVKIAVRNVDVSDHSHCD